MNKFAKFFASSKNQLYYFLPAYIIAASSFYGMNIYLQNKYEAEFEKIQHEQFLESHKVKNAACSFRFSR